MCVCVEPVGHIYGGWVNVRLGLGLLGVCVCVEPVGHIYGGWVNVRLGLGLLDGCVCRTSLTYIWWVGECPTGIRSIRWVRV